MRDRQPSSQLVHRRRMTREETLSLDLRTRPQDNYTRRRYTEIVENEYPPSMLVVVR